MGGLKHKNQACHAHFHFELKIAGIQSALKLEISVKIVFGGIFLAEKLTQNRLFWVQNENKHGKLDFGVKTTLFSKINTTFLDVWMILLGLFDISISFRFQSFPRTYFSRYGGLYGIMYTIMFCSRLEYDWKI